MDRSSGQVLVVTDSTADVPKALAESVGLTIVPLSVRFGERTYLDGVDLGPTEFLRLLKSSTELPKTSQPATTAFESVIRSAVDAGRSVACFTIASRLSGTFNAARLAAETVDSTRVRVVDSGTVTMHLGWGAVAAARTAAAGASLDEVVAAGTETLRRTRLYALLETLDYVYKGGRIGKASQLVGSVLAIKPILSVRDGEVIPIERVRTWKKALDRIAELAREQAPLESLAVMHIGNAADADDLVGRLADLVPRERIVVTEAGPVIATYAGPGAVGVMPVGAARN
jgi:DegV family protein with EDD domain